MPPRTSNIDPAAEQAAADAQSALAALAQQLADRHSTGAHGPARPMRSSMQLAYRTLMEREFRRLERLTTQRSDH